MKLTLTFTLLTSLVAVAFASVADTVNNIENIKTQILTLHNTVAALPDTGGSLLSAMSLHSGASNVVAATKKGIADFNGLPKPLSEADGDQILAAYQGVEPGISDVSSTIVAKRDTFRSVPLVGSLVNPVAQYYFITTRAFGSQLLDAFTAAGASDAQLDRAKSLKTFTEAAIDRAIAAYS
ncbi:hypothetical protein GALMADRAFT_1353220 [Galerina marginata CBS 339.88]|uniref:Hydrophobic surface binding protein n=1 Tax=Galerina marginata (strain CBS 339.88) TaxID=685588 RepID=A0A067SFR5_GALM3|nr:hypothetical protein GALMADRAFT_1353220 [Galerina marginata CBS 339.88]